ncbi:MAG: type II toxin-antitoxin system PemK/MazF family toxin [Acetobacteraceae bacterium]|nr:type II toxin-antitoxin system PemK/MazF family toxin [Acetobacteraceae bacterium]MBV8869079.1 type II toxin-antitoxin system PemK/MazF family toxin [Acetobacteraceae bacterium]
MASDYGPDAGDLIWTEFDPRVGREQGGRRPALVLSPRPFWEASRLAFVCPITSRVRGWSSSLILPAGLVVSGEVLISHMRSIDTLARPIVHAGAVPFSILEEARARLATLLGIES